MAIATGSPYRTRPYSFIGSCGRVITHMLPTVQESDEHAEGCAYRPLSGVWCCAMDCPATYGAVDA